MINVALALAFGRDGNAENHLGPGWSAGEAGFRWMIGPASDLWLSRPPRAADAIFEITLHPNTRAPTLPAQRLTVLARGVELGRITLASTEVCGWHIPAALLTGPGPVRITFQHPDATAPSKLSGGSDERPLAFSVREARLCLLDADPADANRGAAGGIATVAGGIARPVEPARAFPSRPDAAAFPVSGPADLVSHFASLGDGPEFGLFQRTCGHEPSGLLDLASIGIGDLLRGIESGFAGLGAPGSLALSGDPARPERALRDQRFGITFAAAAPDGDAALLAHQASRLPQLAATFSAELARGSGRIHVVKRNDGLPEALVLPLYRALNRHACNPLLWVVPADAAHPSGTVERLLPGLLRGHIDRFAPYARPQDLSWSAWLSLCRNAYNLLHGTMVEAFPTSPGVASAGIAIGSPTGPVDDTAMLTTSARGPA